MRILRAWLRYFFVLIILIIFKYFYIEYMPILFVFVVAILPLIGLLHIIIGIFTIKTSIKFSSEICTKNEIMKLKIIVSNNSFFPFPMVKIKYSIPERVNIIAKMKIHTANFLPRQSNTIEHDILCKYRGIYEGNIIYIEMQDLFSFFKFKVKSKETFRFMVIPRKIIIPYSDENLLSEANNSEFTSNTVDLSNIIGTHKYVLGDELKLVHWNHSAKLDDIMVKEFQEENEYTTLIAIDLKAYYKNETNYIANDGVVETAIALSLKHVIETIPIDIIWYNLTKENISCINLLSVSDFGEFFNNISLVDLYTNEVSLDKLIVNHLEYNKNYNSMFVISSNFDLDLISQLFVLAKNIQINFVYFEVENELEVENIITSLKYNGIKLWYIKHGEIINAFGG